MRAKRLFSLILIFTCFALVSCGIKPGDVDAPPGASRDTYPHTYPDLSTDPPPATPRP